MDEIVGALVELALSHGPFVVRTTPSLTDARAIAAGWRPELYVVHVDAPGGQPLALLRDRSEGVPLIALTTHHDVRSRLDAFERGADDVMSFPVDPEELLARVLALIRRAYGRTLTFTPTIAVGGLRIDLSRGTATLGSRRVALTPLELRLLYVLAASAGRTLSRQRLLDTIWGIEFVADSNVIDRHVRNLRVKLGDDARRPRVIRTVPGEGYTLALGGAAERRRTRASPR